MSTVPPGLKSPASMPPPIAPSPIKPIVSVMMNTCLLPVAARLAPISIARARHAAPGGSVPAQRSRAATSKVGRQVGPQLLKRPLDIAGAVDLDRAQAAGARTGDVFGAIIEKQHPLGGNADVGDHRSERRGLRLARADLVRHIDLLKRRQQIGEPLRPVGA